jgi:hypothetical protein
MRKAALKAQHDYAVRALTERICAGLPSKAYLDEYLAVYYFNLSHVRYMRDPRTVELVRDPALLCRQILAGDTPSADCDDDACLLGAKCLALGGECCFVTVAFRNMFHRGQRQFSHVFAQAREPQTGVWITLDPVAADRTNDMMRRAVAWRRWPVA